MDCVYLRVGICMQAIPHNPLAHTHMHTQLQAAQVFKGAIGVVMRPAGIYTHFRAKYSVIH